MAILKDNVTLDGQPIKQAAPPLEGVEASLEREMLYVPLRPAPVGVSPERLKFPWHRVEKLYYTPVRITSSDDKNRIVKVSVESDHRGWKERWYKFSYAIRKARELQGGDAVDAQDSLSEDERSVTILLTPGETREVTLEFMPQLDGETEPGRYLFDVVVQDVTELTEKPEERLVGTLVLQHPDSRLLAMLPAIYSEAMLTIRQESDSIEESPFFERFLLGFDDAIEPLMQTLNQLEKLFGAFTTPPDFVLWLAAWVAAPLDENWPEMRRRKLIREAVEIYRWRGTMRGLKHYLKVYAGVEPDINDQPVEGMRLGKHAKLGTAATVLGDVPPHTFVVTLAVPDPSAINESIVRDIIKFEKPAHTAFALRIVRKLGSE
ncbi:MAG TPA: phage tail protein [Fimbriimonadaceae bacterium]|nr:phage tail protein [Fimbriimonadaceae bacterium]